jgi:serine/threonine protein kinase
VVYLESIGVVHRDLKPDNVMISLNHDAEKGSDKVPEIKLIDFNVAFCFDVASAEKPIKIKGGTGLKHWSAPETRLQLFYGIESESWTIGCLLYFVLFGVAPFNEDSDLKNQSLQINLALEQD